MTYTLDDLDGGMKVREREREREGGLFYVLCHAFSGLELKLRETLRNRNERNKL